MPRASVVIPCYNAERHLSQTLQSVIEQTVRDIEILCVDNNSTDGTRQILEDYAALDSRFRIIEELEPGEGPARDAGLRSATGEWLYFLDSDDIMEPTLLQESIIAGEREAADVVIFRTLSLDDMTGELCLVDFSFKRDWLPDEMCTFAPREHPSRILNSFQNWVHNKLFRGSFVRGCQLSFQHIHRTADLLFTCRALTEARLITLLDRPLHRYRVNNPQSAMATSDSHPLDFLDAFIELRHALESEGTWDLYHDSYVQWAMEGCCINLEIARSYEGFATIASKLCETGFEQLDVIGYPRDRCAEWWFWDRCHALLEKPLDQIIFDHFSMMRRFDANDRDECSRLRIQVSSLQGRVDDLENQNAFLRNSTSFRVGLAMTAPARALKDRLGK